jgi:trimeric autotransporter adhesin
MFPSWLIRSASMSALLVCLGYAQNAHAQSLPTCPSQPTSSCGLRLSAQNDWHFIAGETRAFVNESTFRSIYMDNRPPNETWTLTVSGSDMSGFYVQGSTGGTANITLQNGAIADLVEAGTALVPATNANILIDGSVLNGAQTGRIYDALDSGNKDYALGSAIFVDLQDRGNHTITVRNGSELHGSIVTGFGPNQTVTVTDSTIDSGGIYVAGDGNNTVSVTNSTIDATNSQVAANLAQLAQEIAARIPEPIDISGVDDLAIGVIGPNVNSVTVVGSTVIGDIGVLNVGSGGTINISITDGSTIVGDVIWRGDATVNLDFSGSTIEGDVLAEDIVVELSDSTMEGDFTTIAGSTHDVTLSNDSQLTGSITTVPGSTYNLALTESTWETSGSSNLTNLTNGGGSEIHFAEPAGDPALLSSYKTLEVAEAYVGGGGTLSLNTFLAGDGSPSDRLVIDGTAMGTTSVIATDTGGGGR